MNDRVAAIQNMVTNALGLYREIKDAGVIFFDKNCEGEHLIAWNRVLRQLGRA